MSLASFARHDSYKDSGVDWIGDVPTDWIVKPLRRFINVQSGDMISSDAE
jgi:type I restriction enzyme S subunit